ncbi:entericidin EcnA/B family protein [uncultured Salipiger sp.]|nr:entericidin EcnA/B family protein [uncultured Salipiger sp.]
MKQAILMAFVALVAACGTIDGVGQDISSASRTVESWF